MSLADTILLKILSRAERSKVNLSDRAIRESLKSPNHAFWTLGYDQRNALYERMRAAERAGCVRLEWSRLGGDDRPLEGIVLSDLDRLAIFLGRVTNSEVVDDAKAMLSPWLDNKRVVEVIRAWENLKSVRTLGPESAADFADAIKVMTIARSESMDELIARPLSTRLFGNSKRIEALIRHLDILSAESLIAPARHSHEVLGELGISKEPQPFLVAGSGTLLLAPDQVCPIVRPFIGVSNREVSGYQGYPAWVLTIENLTTFHQAARLLVGREDGLVIYTGGMPSPAWRAAFRNVIGNMPNSVEFYHWGDFDEGGFRIAKVLQATASDVGKLIRPWRMDAESARESGVQTTPAIASNMARFAKNCGWDAISDGIKSLTNPFTAEQEGLALVLPDIHCPCN
jgi:Uncharacterized protein conserved in bacteria C-term(DUF2220)